MSAIHNAVTTEMDDILFAEGSTPITRLACSNGSGTISPVATEETHLEIPTPELESAYRDFIQEFRSTAPQGYQLATEEAIADFRAFVRRLLDGSRGLGLPAGWVPQTTYWLVADDGQVIGEIRIRHRLTPTLEDWGGHIGYAIRPTQQGKGHGTRMLAMALKKACGLGLDRVLITCASENSAPARVIEKNGGRLASKSMACTGRLTSRYWIDLRATNHWTAARD